MDYNLKLGDDVLAKVANGMGALSEGRAKKVMVRALNRAGNPTFTKVKRALVRSTSAPMAIVNKQVSAQRAWAGNDDAGGKLKYIIRATGSPLPLRFFTRAEFSYGVRAKVWGRFQRFPGAFMRGGAWPNRVDLTKGGMRGNVFVRTSKARLPVKVLYGPALPKELIEPKIAKVFDGMAVRLGGDISHELDRELSKFG